MMSALVVTRAHVVAAAPAEATMMLATATIIIEMVASTATTMVTSTVMVAALATSIGVIALRVRISHKRSISIAHLSILA